LFIKNAPADGWGALGEFEIWLAVGELGNFEDFLNHIFLMLVVMGVNGVIEARVQVVLHEHLVGTLDEAHKSGVLLHNINTVHVVFYHFNHAGTEAVYLFQRDADFIFLIFLRLEGYGVFQGCAPGSIEFIISHT
jgi:hypothetical protein